MLTRKFRPLLEVLNDRTTPSVVPVVHPQVIVTEPPVIISPPPVLHPIDPLPPVTSPPVIHRVLLTGGGTYTQPLINVDAGTSYQLSGTITHSFLSFNVKGWIQGTGMIQSGRASGHLVLTNEFGSITLELHGPVQNGFSPVPSELVFTVSGATGKFSNAKGYGIVHTTFTPAPVAVGMPLTGEYQMTIY